VKESVKEPSTKQSHIFTHEIAQSANKPDSSSNKTEYSFSYWLNKNKYYHQRMRSFYQSRIPSNSSVLHVNCTNGYVLEAVEASIGVGVDSNPNYIAQAQAVHPHFTFFHGDISQVKVTYTFDYIVLSFTTMEVNDIQTLLEQLHPFCNPGTRIIIETYSYLWEPVLWLTQKLGLRRPTQFKNWLSCYDVQNFLHLAGFETVTTTAHMLMPMYLPVVSWICNVLLAPLPFINKLCLHQNVIARPVQSAHSLQQYTVSIIATCRNERGNIERVVKECPRMGKHTEIIFVEGGSQDNTLEEIQRVAEHYKNEWDISWFVQDGTGKGDAVRKGFAQAKGDILMILDADLTMPAEELPKFFEALVTGKGEFINGSRLVYSMESGAMRFLNLVANFFFGLLFSWLLEQRVKDTLCGTKVLWRKHYEHIAANRALFGLEDPFGDFDLLFGASKLNLKIIDMPIRYKDRTYGQTNIRRFWHGFILLWISINAMRIFKFK
jgi:ubiquinone/menaquinone biosynthesis C-methylase UbiE